MPISKNAMVTIRYAFRDQEGYLKDFTKPEVITYLQGRGHMLPGVERVLMGKNAGEQVHVTLPPEEAFGTFQESLLKHVPKSQFAGMRQVKTGMQFDLLASDGSIKIWTVVEVGEDSVVLDGNHPLAGLHMEFDLTIIHVHELQQ